MGKVTDPAVLAQLDGPAAGRVVDPSLLAQLEGRPDAGSAGGAFTEHAANSAMFGFGDEAVGGYKAIAKRLLPKALGGVDAGTSLGDLYRHDRDEVRARLDAEDAGHPTASLAGELAGAVLPAIASGGAGSGPRAPGLLRAIGRTAATGAKLGGVAGLGNSKADLTSGDVAGAAKDTAIGAGAGAGTAAAATGGGALLKRLVTGAVQLDPANQFLRRMGVRNLTLGQAAPESWFSSIEQAAESLPIIGDVIKSQRQAGRESWQRVVLNEARAPGAPLVDGANPAEILGKVADTFDSAYQPIAALPVEASIAAPQGRFAVPGARLPLSSAFREAAADPRVRASDDVRRSVAGFLDNAHSELVNTPQARPLSAGDLISVRSAIRSEIRSELGGSNPDYASAKLLRIAEDAVSRSLEEQLPDQAAASLRATDAQYAKLMRVTDAVRRSGDQPGGFTPAQLSAAVKAGAEKNAYAQGGGGELRDLAQAGRRTLDTRVPPTGARLLTLGAGTAALPVTAALAAGATTDIGKQLLTGGTRPQIAVRPLLEFLERQRIAAAAARAASLGGAEAATQ